MRDQDIVGYQMSIQLGFEINPGKSLYRKVRDSWSALMRSFPGRLRQAARRRRSPSSDPCVTMRETHTFQGFGERQRLRRGPRRAGTHNRTLLSSGRFLSLVGRRENFGYKSLQRRGSGVLFGAWLERL
jgi:hypothetical protein